jgi:GNAT superfamily N-acetyltransferase
MNIQKCTLTDCALLAAMNKQLIEDEKHDNPMSLDQLVLRMREFLAGDYGAYLFINGDEIVGYALVKESVSPKYLRQFFICRDHRRKGFGRAFFSKLMDLLGEKAIDVEVLCWNESAIQFWRELGFSPRSIYMCYRQE